MLIVHYFVFSFVYPWLNQFVEIFCNTEEFQKFVLELINTRYTKAHASNCLTTAV